MEKKPKRVMLMKMKGKEHIMCFSCNEEDIIITNVRMGGNLRDMGEETQIKGEL